MEPQAENTLNNSLRLRDVKVADLAIFFEHQLDPKAIYMAAFTAKDPADREAFTARWGKIMANDSIDKKTILLGRQVVGHVLSFEQFGETEVSYWIGREFWGHGIATEALAQFLNHEGTRPLYARAAKDNIASVRVLEKNGFRIIGEDKGFANGRGKEIEEFVLKLTVQEHPIH